MSAANIKKAFVQSFKNQNKKFELLDETIVDYLCGLFEDSSFLKNESEVFDTVSPLLMDSGCVKNEKEAESLCREIITTLKGGKQESGGPKNANGTAASSTASDGLKALKLNAPIKLSDQLNKVKEEVPDWMIQKDKVSYVDQDKLQAVQAKKEKRKEAKIQREENKKKEKNPEVAELVAAMAMTVVDHSEGQQGRARDVSLENFDISYGKDQLVINASITLSYGRRYGLVGRNGTGKTTLLKHIAHREIQGIPNHMRILHVEQEVVGDDTTAIDAVLQCDIERANLLEEEKKLLAETNQELHSDRLQKIYERLQSIDAYGAEAKAAVILVGLGFSQEMLGQQTKSFSGGWRMRIALARALFCKPDLLLLDEPTNHLDLYAIIWLENYLQNWKGTILIVSHQRAFLNCVATDILHLFNKKIDHYKGNYDMFEQVRYDRLLQQQRKFDAQQKQIKHVQAFIDRFRYNAKRASMVQSRIKSLEKMEVVEEVLSDPTLTIQFSDPETLTPPILQFQDASFSYPGSSKMLFRNLDMGIDLESRVALVGANGVGKSTLLNILAGEMEPTKGLVLRHGKLRFARFSQHFVDQLNLDQSPLEHFMSVYPGILPLPARAHLGSFGLSGDLALRTINTLSGGQKSRLVFAVMAFRKPHVLLLDEPTNHLDMETIDSLVKALLTFRGGVLLISHDERLISLVCDQIWYFRDGKVMQFNGEFTEYKKMLEDELRQQKMI